MTKVEFEIRVAGEIHRDVLAQLPGIAVTRQPVGSVLIGDAVDQAALYGVINRIRGLGLDLIEVRRRPDDDGRPETEDIS